MTEVQIRDKDIRRVARVIDRHEMVKQPEPFRGKTEEWAVLRFAIRAFPVLVQHGYIGLTDREDT